MGNTEQKKQWHMGFYGAMELEFREDKDSLEFYREYQLSKKPLEMDMLIVRKSSNVSTKNLIGKIFRKHNIIEYKSPDDSLGIDQFYKGIAYACLYKSQGNKSDAIDPNELTLSFIRDRYPDKLIRRLTSLGYEVREEYPGIYYIHGKMMFPVQIVVTRRLEPMEHLSLKVLSNKADKICAKSFLKEMSNLAEQGDRENIDAVLQISVAANWKLYDEIKEESHMCEALRELMKDEIAADVAKAKTEGRAQGRAEGKAEGRAQGKIEGKIESVRALMQNTGFSVEKAMEVIGIPKNEYKKYLKKCDYFNL